jgi:hypothetical protein
MTDTKQEALAKLLNDFKGSTDERSRRQAKRVPAPKLSGKRKPSKEDQWASLVWNIDTAEEHGARALKGLTLALIRIIQAEILKALFLDARPGKTADDCPNTLLWDSSIAIGCDGATMSDLLHFEKGSITLDIAHSAVIPQPWEHWRLARALQNLGPDGIDGVWRQMSNTHAVAWMPWPLVWIDNGNHTAMATIVTHNGTLEVSEWLDAKELLLSVYCDGINWLRVDDDQIIAPVQSLPMAGIFEIGRRLVRATEKKSD